MFENAGNDLNNEAFVDTSKRKSSISSLPPKARGIKQSKPDEVNNKIESLETFENEYEGIKNLESNIWVQISGYLNIRYLIFKYLIFFLFCDIFL